MKLKATFVSLAFAAGILASIALAGPPPGHGHKQDTSTESTTTSTTLPVASCRPRVSLILRGVFTSAASDVGSFTMDVKGANRHGWNLVGKPASVQVDGKTTFRRHGRAALADFVAGDRLNVQVRACKASNKGKHKGHHETAPTETQPALLARRVVGRPGPAQGDDGSTGSTSTATTTETTP